VDLAREVLLRGSGQLPVKPDHFRVEIPLISSRIPNLPAAPAPVTASAPVPVAMAAPPPLSASARRGQTATFRLRFIIEGSASSPLGLAVTDFVSEQGVRIGAERVAAKRLPGEGVFDVEVALPAGTAPGCYFGLAVVTGAEDSHEILRLSVED
jgi:hypothetical protein